MNRTTRTLTVLAAGAGIVALLGVPGPVAGPDLVAVFANGPGQTHANSQQIVAIHVANLGDALVGDYTAEVVLSEDDVVDAGDLVVGTIDSDFLGTQGVLVDVPFAVPTGQLRWGLRVLAAPGETNLDNNTAIGTVTNIFKTDLSVPDADPIELFWRPTDGDAPTAEIVIENVGSMSSILVFTAETLNPTPWLDLDPESSFAIAGEDGNAVTLVTNPEGLAIGTYNTTVRFQNFTEVTDYVDVDVSLTIGPAIFTPGDRLVGHISVPGDIDLVNCDLLEGEKLAIKMKSKQDLKPRVTVIDPDGMVEKVVKFKGGSDYQKKTLKAKKTGTYTLLFEGKGSSIGSFHVKTGRKLPKKAQPRKVKVTGDAQGKAFIDVLAHDGAKLDFAVAPKSSLDEALALILHKPLGGVVDLNTAVQFGPGDEVLCEDLTVDEIGAYQIEIGGLGQGAKAKVSVFPVHPQKPRAKIYLP